MPAATNSTLAKWLSLTSVLLMLSGGLSVFLGWRLHAAKEAELEQMEKYNQLLAKHGQLLTEHTDLQQKYLAEMDARLKLLGRLERRW